MRYGPFESPSWGRHWYNDENDTIILQDGRSFPRPENISKESLTQRNYDVIEIKSATQVKTLGGDDLQYHITVAACNRAIELMMSARGTTSIKQYILFKENRLGLNSTSPEVVDPTRIFQTIIGGQSPTIAIDRRIEDNPALAGEHPRAHWDGELTTFRIRDQVIRLNPFWLDYATECFEREDSAFVIAFFRLVHTIHHEYWHILQTFLGKGREDTPPLISGGRASRGTHEADSTGEAGEFGEKKVLGGPVNFPRDPYPNGGLLFKGEYVGYPWIRDSAGDDWRVTEESLVRLMHTDWKDPMDASTPFLARDETYPAVKRPRNPDAGRRRIIPYGTPSVGARNGINIQLRLHRDFTPDAWAIRA